MRSIVEAWGHGDFSSAEWADPEIEFVIVDGPSPRISTGLGGLARGHREWLSAWEGFRSQAQEYRELDAERVLVPTQYSGRGKTSGLELEQMQAKGAGVAHICDARVTRLVWYANRERALAELGLASQGGAAVPPD